MQNTVHIKAYAKINLFLEVLDKREDGFHNIDSTMQTVSLYDDITVERCADGIDVVCPGLNIPKEQNLAYKAAVAFCLRYGIKDGLRITIDKKIPHGAGLAGGSADAAGVIRALKFFYPVASEDEILQICANIGSDVPFCYFGGTKRVLGRGEKIIQAHKMPPCFIAVVKDDLSSSTDQAYTKLDNIKREIRPNMTDRACEGGIVNVAASLFNRFEDISPYCSEIKNLFLSCGAVGALLSGSGSAVFGIFRDKETAQKCIEKIAKPNRFAALCEPCEVE